MKVFINVQHWNESLAHIAQEHAKICNHNHNLEKMYKGSVLVMGENLGYATRLKDEQGEKFLVQKALQHIASWTDEQKNFIFPEPTGRGAINHYTQVTRNLF